MSWESFGGPPHFGHLLLSNCGGPSSLLTFAAGPYSDDPGPPYQPCKCSILNGDVAFPFYMV